MDNQHVSYSETWKVYEYNLRYEVSDKGNVRCARTNKIKRLSVNKQGYYEIQFKVNSKRFSKKVHRMVAETFLQEPSKELHEKCSNEHWKRVLVKHKDNNKLNNCVENLQWCDLKENTMQAWKDGLITPLKGSENGRAKLDERTVESMCKDFESGMMPKEAVKKYGVSQQQATKIRAGIQWKHVWSKYNIQVNRRNKNIND